MLVVVPAEEVADVGAGVLDGVEPVGETRGRALQWACATWSSSPHRGGAGRLLGRMMCSSDLTLDAHGERSGDGRAAVRDDHP